MDCILTVHASSAQNKTENAMLFGLDKKTHSVFHFCGTDHLFYSQRSSLTCNSTASEYPTGAPGLDTPSLISRIFNL